MTKQLSMQYDAKEEVGEVKHIKLGELFTKTASVNPAKHTDEVFELYSIPSYDNGMPDLLKGSEIGSSKKSIKENDVLLSRIVPHIRRCWVVSESDDIRKIGSSEWIVFRSDKVIPHYLRYFLLSNSFHNRFIQTISGVGGSLMRARPSEVAKLKIPLPPLPIQRKIAEVLDRADALRQRNRRIIAHYDQLAQSVFLDMFGDPVTNPKGWDIEKLQSFGNWRSGGTPSRKNSEYFNGTIPWLSSGELENIFIDDSKEYITEEAIKRSAASIVEPYSLLLGMYDTAALKSTINTVPCSCNQAIAFAKINSEMANTVFLYYLIQVGKEHYRRLQRGVRQKNMNLSMIKSMPVLSPPLSLQNQFATIIQRVETQKQRQQAELAKSEELFQSLLQRAFRGELFTQEKKIQQMDMF